MLRTFRNGAGPYLMAGIRGFPRARRPFTSFRRDSSSSLPTSKGTLLGRKNIPLFRERPTDCPLLPIVGRTVTRKSYFEYPRARGWEISGFFNAAITTF